jgi:hypothetical protein
LQSVSHHSTSNILLPETGNVGQLDIREFKALASDLVAVTEERRARVRHRHYGGFSDKNGYLGRPYLRDVIP